MWDAIGAFILWGVLAAGVRLAWRAWSASPPPRTAEDIAREGALHLRERDVSYEEYNRIVRGEGRGTRP
jgi:hypothetical protein